MNKNVEYLKKVPFFEGLTEVDLKIVSDVMIERAYPKGSVLFMEGEIGRASCREIV